MSTVVSRAPGRISLVGGGTDLPAYYERHGGAVVSFAVDQYSYAQASERRADLELVSLDSGARELIPADTFTRRTRTPILAEDFLLYQKAVAAHFGLDRGRLAVTSELPTGAGMASSGSVCVALVQAAATFVGEDLTREQIAEAACSIEMKMLDRACGKQDQYASVFGGVNLIEFARDGQVQVTPIRMPRTRVDALKQRILLFHNGSRRSAVGPLQEQARRSASDPDTITALGALKELAYEMRDVLVDGDLSQIGHLLHRAWEHKQHLNSQVSTPEITRVYALARRAGAVGGKLAGAGVAGTLVLYCHEETQDDVRRMLASQGWRERRAAIDFGGVGVRAQQGEVSDLVRS